MAGAYGGGPPSGGGGLRPEVAAQRAGEEEGSDEPECGDGQHHCPTNWIIDDGDEN